LAVELSTTSVKLEALALNYSVAHLRLKENVCANGMAGEAPALKPKLADNVVLKLKPFMAARPARRETNAA
jgi:hypothetical protein